MNQRAPTPLTALPATLIARVARSCRKTTGKATRMRLIAHAHLALRTRQVEAWGLYPTKAFTSPGARGSTGTSKPTATGRLPAHLTRGPDGSASGDRPPEFREVAPVARPVGPVSTGAVGSIGFARLVG